MTHVNIDISARNIGNYHINKYSIISNINIYIPYIDGEKLSRNAFFSCSVPCSFFILLVILLLLKKITYLVFLYMYIYSFGGVEKCIFVRKVTIKVIQFLLKSYYQSYAISF